MLASSLREQQCGFPSVLQRAFNVFPDEGEVSLLPLQPALPGSEVPGIQKHRDCFPWDQRHWRGKKPPPQPWGPILGPV